MVSSTQFSQWNNTISQVLSKEFSTQSMSLLLRSVEELVDASSGIITVYPSQTKPYSPHHRLLANEDSNLQLDKYADGAYLLDPFYTFGVKKSREGVFSLRQLAPEGFTDSEYFHVFYHQLDYVDEASLLFQINSELFISISVGRLAMFAPFTEQEIKLLNSAFPLLKSLLTVWANQHLTDQTASLEWQLDRALTNFGSSLLTPKECEILHLILHGYAVKSIAQQLENSLETIKHHRRNIYTKLDVNSQSELFYLFIASLKQLPTNSSQDPLIYMQ